MKAAAQKIDNTADIERELAFARRTRENLDAVREKGKRENAERAAAHRAVWIEKSLLWLQAQPYLKDEEVVFKLWQWCRTIEGPKMKNGKTYAQRTIHDALRPTLVEWRKRKVSASL